MKRYAIDLDLSRCISCGACMIACMDQNDTDVEGGFSPFRQVFDTEEETAEGRRYSHISIACMHCTDAPCITGCPSACLKKDPETNMTVYDTTNCIGCHSCAMACPYGIPSFGADGKMVKCDGCFMRVREGMLPACVKTCPMSALKLVEIDEAPQIAPEHSLRETSMPMLKRQV
ncbi:MAG: 4Fe-4S dicluster domain-containing protein [Eubacteriales bacterium]|nr:4Fe-4S dicluster domain-containing protein [Eubacteriales bacterium]